ncbi:DUF5412 family protein [Alkalihalobacterium bogoriense]|uniref:DUF5412 family protein n=1 Tax=Alkalihalobacterium bogoriense TaxID=246272 RepID=UPI00054E9807|nr:DUF5412 family protein [Alkalihalobacterium bogoriense]
MANKKFRTRLFVILSGFLLILFIFFYGVNKMFFSTDLSNINGTFELQESIDSPDGTFTANVYLVNAHSTVKYSLAVGIDSNNEKFPELNDKIIYWHYPESEYDVEWLDDETIIINGTHLNIFKDTYHWRKDGKN